MSRTYRNKIRIGICCGCNTDWYQQRRKWQRNKNRHELRNKLANYILSEIDNVLSFTKLPKRDTWCEPTDGSWLLDNLVLQRRYNKEVNKPLLIIKNYSIPYDFYDYYFLKRKYSRYLKSKHLTNKYSQLVIY